jgi:hypothetical protein
MSLAEAAARRPSGALVAPAELARRARVMFGAPARELWTALLPLLEKRSSSSSAFSPAGGARPTPSQAEATVRRTEALMALGATSVLMLALFPQAEELRHGALTAYAVALLGCAAVLLSPAVAEHARLAARRQIQGASNAVLRWAGLTCIFFCCVIAAGVRAVENSLFLLLPFMVGVWAVSLSMLAARDPPTLPLMWAPEGHDGGVVVVNVTAPPAAHGVAA